MTLVGLTASILGSSDSARAHVTSPRWATDAAEGESIQGQFQFCSSLSKYWMKTQSTNG